MESADGTQIFHALRHGLATLSQDPEPAVNFLSGTLQSLSMLQVREEIKYQSRRLNKYTCMAVWGGNNELEPALDWFPESRDNPISCAVDFAEIFINTIRPVLASVDKGKHGIPFVDSSPSNGIVSKEPYVKRYCPSQLASCTRQSCSTGLRSCSLHGAEPCVV